MVSLTQAVLLAGSCVANCYLPMLQVASTPDGSSISSVQVLNSVSKASAVNINAVDAPFVSNVTSNAFVLNVQLKLPGEPCEAVHCAPRGPINSYARRGLP
jgi:hypothetical protein